MSEPRAAAACGRIRRRCNVSDLLFVGLGGIALIQLQGRLASPLGLQDTERALVHFRNVDLALLAAAPPTLAAAAMALLGPLLIRLPWRAGLALTGLALHLERTAEVALDVLPPALGLAGTLMLALGLRHRLQRRARPADAVCLAITGEAPGQAHPTQRRRS